jgi:hypothetical protein
MARLILALVALATGIAAAGMCQERQRPAEGNRELTGPASATPAKEETPHEKRVKAAINKGVLYLQKQLREGTVPAKAPGIQHADTQIGITALMGLALLEAGTRADDAAMRTARATVRQNSGRLTTVYSLATTIFLLNRLNEVGELDEAGKKTIRTLALRLIAGQNPSGQWSYQNPALSPQDEEALLKKLVSGKYRPRGAVSYYGSNSMTQFAMLSLWGARHCGIPVRAPLLKAAEQFHSTQLRDGAWPYRREQRLAMDSNTSAGLLALGIEHALRNDKAFADDPAPVLPPKVDLAKLRHKALSRLGQVIGRAKGTGRHLYPGMGMMINADALGDCYFLWCLERVAVIYGMKEIDGKDWYQWGSTVLLKAQRADGTWSDGYAPAIDTSFAILFLTRANLANDLTRMLLRDGIIQDLERRQDRK